MSTSTTIEIDRFTREGHQRFKKAQRFEVKTIGGPAMMTWQEWMNWQATRDPLNDDPKEAEKVRARIEKERRGPGLSRRPRPTPGLISKAQVAESSAKVEEADKGPSNVVSPNFQRGSEGGCYS